MPILDPNSLSHRAFVKCHVDRLFFGFDCLLNVCDLGCTCDSACLTQGVLGLVQVDVRGRLHGI